MEDEITIDLGELLSVLKSRYKFILKLTGLCVIAAGGYLMIASPVYESEALLRIKQPRGIASSLLDGMSGNSMASKQLMSTYAEILKSRSVIIPVIEKVEEPNEEGKYPSYNAYVNRVATTPYKDTEIMKVAVQANSPEKAQHINNLIVESFLQRLTDLVRNEQKLTRVFIGERLLDAKKELNTAEDKLTAYKKTTKILSPSDEVKLISEKVGVVDTLRAENRVALAAAKAKLEAVGEQLQGAGKATVENSVIQHFSSQIAQLEAERISYLDKYTAKHPKVIETEAAIAKLKQKQQEEIDKVVAFEAPSNNPVHQQLLNSKFNSEAEINIAQANLDELDRLEYRNQQEINRLSENEQQYLGLLRDVNVAQEIYIMLAKRLEEAKVAEVAVPTEVQVVDSSTLPEAPIKPKKAMTLLLAAFLGLLGSCGFVVVSELLNKTIKNADDVTNYLDLPVIGSIPDYNAMDKIRKDFDEEGGLLTKLGRFLWKQ